MKIISKILRYLRSVILSIGTRHYRKKIFLREYVYIKEKLKDFPEINPDYVEKEWLEYCNNITGVFLKKLPFCFLRQPVIKQTMFLYTDKKWRTLQKQLIKKEFGTQLPKILLKETNVGCPLLSDKEFFSSSNSIHHLYHLALFQQHTGMKVLDAQDIIEIGGGYGNMARILYTHQPRTYTIIDLPIFSAIQAIYLSTIFGRENVNIITHPSCSIKENCINIIPFSETNLSQIPRNSNLLISTWALSESNQRFKELIAQNNYFNAEWCLIAYQKSNQDFPTADKLPELMTSYKIVYNEKTAYLDQNFYLFAQHHDA